MSFQQGLSGLNAAADDLDVIGNNISNSATVGFKSGATKFADVFAGTAIGMGTKVSGVATDYNAGSVTSTGNEYDIAINGDKGFFRLVDSSGNINYSRNGQFTLDKNRYIVNDAGAQLTGYQGKTIGTDPVALQIPVTNIAPVATTTGAAKINLDSRATPIATSVTFDPTKDSTYSHSAPVTVYDSLGAAHTLTQYFIKRASTSNNQKQNQSTWDVQYALDGTVVAGNAQTLTFDTNGALVSPTQAVNLAFTGVGSAASPATDLNIALDYTGTTQLSGDYTTDITQNGNATGTFSNVEISPNGAIVANYSNGKTQTVGTIALADFANLQGLARQGNNAYGETSESGPATLGQPGTNGLSTLEGKSVEASNVDMATDLVNLIVAQRTYQANAQTIKAQDQILQTLVNI